MANEIVLAGSTALAVPEPSYFMPIVAVEQAIQRRKMVEGFAKSVMIAGTDYGEIPGTGQGKKGEDNYRPGKNVLLKPGAEKLASFFGMVPDFTVMHAILDFDGAGEGNGEALLYYRIRCDLYRSGVKVGSGDASCSSRESKYRWRNAQRVCPNCGQAAIIKGKEEYGGGWLCFKKSGGCGAKFGDADQSIVGQAVGRVPNADIADLDNTILKMAEKRALIAATLIATNVSDFFTQDMEDFADVDSTARYVAEPAQEQPKAAAPEPPSLTSTPAFKRMHALGREVLGEDWRNGTGRDLLKSVTGKESTKALTADEISAVIQALEAMRPEPEPLEAVQAKAELPF